jgi:hypothetical protein
MLDKERWQAKLKAHELHEFTRIFFILFMIIRVWNGGTGGNGDWERGLCVKV